MQTMSLVAHTHTFAYGDNTVTLSSGEMARQATGAVLVDVDGTCLLVTVVGVKKANPAQTFFPLTVNYQEKTYAAGKIPGGFFKREGRPSERETLTARLIDRPIRPLFPEGFMNEVQVVAQVVSLNPEVSPDIPAMIGTSAALAISGIPFEGPIGAARVGYVNGHFVLNPTEEVLAKDSSLDLVVAGTQTSVLMVESEAAQLPEDIMLEAVMFGHHHLQTAINAIKTFAKPIAKPTWEWTPVVQNPELVALVKETCAKDIANAYLIADKTKRQDTLAACLEAVIAKLVVGDEPKWSKDAVSAQFESIERAVVRGRILEGEPRIDGRDTETVRPIVSRVGVLPRTHGSALFTRGETQALVVATVGTGRDAQTIDKIGGEAKETFMLHYNFPPFCVGETGMIGSPKRREIGHGRLAKRGIQAVMPDNDAYPYVVRVVSEVLESNGSSSMATVCGTSLALMDAGVPISSPVAGIAMGLIKDEGCFAVLTDILGDEDHLGDMDFKVAGTDKGVTALQMDIKINGITREIMEVALDQAKAGRMHILGCMAKTITKPRTEMSEFAPRMITFTIRQDKIRDVIGKGGATIRGLTEEFGTSIEISDDGRISLVAPDNAIGEAVQRRIEELTAEVEVGRIYEGKVARIADFGAFVTILPGRDGLVHISQICEERVNNVSDKLSEGQVVRVKVLEIDKQGRVRLSMKEVNADESSNASVEENHQA